MKKRLLLSILAIGLHSMVHAKEAIAPAVPVLANEAEFFATVNETGGYVNKELHDSFWEVMTAKYNEQQREKIVADIRSSLALLQEFQTKTWESAKQSYYAKNMLWAEGFHPLRSRLLALHSPYFTPQAIVDNAQKIVHAAANRHPLDLGAGKFYITPELIEENLIGMRGSYERLSLLLAKEWKEEYKEYILPKIQVTLLSLYAPDEYEQNVIHEDEKLTLHIAQLSPDKQSMYEIGAVEYQKQDKKFADFSPQEREIYMQEFLKEQFAGYKVTSPMMSQGNWRGYHFSKGVSSYQDYHIIIMSLFMEDKAIYIKHVTDSDLSLASANFNEFTKRLQLLEKT